MRRCCSAIVAKFSNATVRMSEAGNSYHPQAYHRICQYCALNSGRAGARSNAVYDQQALMQLATRYMFVNRNRMRKSIDVKESNTLTDRFDLKWLPKSLYFEIF